MGLFGFAEIITNLETTEKRELVTSKVRGLWPTKAQFKVAWPASLRGTALGSVLGLLPGGGAMLSSFASYALEKKVAKDPAQFGKGAIQGVAGPESANNAGAQTSFIPLLTLGHSRERRDGADGRRDDDPQHPARPAGDDEQSAAVLGPDRVDVGRQPDAGRAQPAADRHVDQAAARCPTACSIRRSCCSARSASIRSTTRSFDVSQTAAVRPARRRLRQARVRAGAAAAGLRARTDDGGESAACDAALARRSDRLLHPPAVAGHADHGRIAAPPDRAPRRSARRATRRSRKPTRADRNDCS